MFFGYSVSGVPYAYPTPKSTSKPLCLVVRSLKVMSWDTLTLRFCLIQQLEDASKEPMGKREKLGVSSLLPLSFSITVLAVAVPLHHGCSSRVPYVLPLAS